MRVLLESGKFLLITKFEEKFRAQGAGAKWDDDKRRWEVRASILSAAQLVSGAKLGDDVQPAREFLKKWDGPVPIVIPSTRLPLMPHQVQGASKLLHLKRFFITFDMGVGKTGAALGAAQELFKEKKIDLVLVVAPLSAFGSWERQIPKFCSVPFRVLQLTGPRKKRIERMEDIRTLRSALVKRKLIFGLINYESLRLFTDDLIKLKPGMVVLDESTFIANRTTQMQKCSKRLSRAAPYSTALTGTPIKNNVGDLFGQLNAVSPEFVGDDYWHYIREFAIFGGFKNKEIVGARNLKGLDWLMQKISMRVRKEEVLQLPARTWETREIELLGDQKEAYEKAESDFYFAVAAVKKHLKGDGERGLITVLIKNALSRLLRCQQIASGHCKSEVGDTLLWPENGKSEDIVQIVREAGDQRVVIFSRFIEDLIQGQKVLKAAGYQAETFYGATTQERRAEIENEFLKDETPLKVVLAQVKTGGFGLDFSKASICVFFNNWFSWSVRDQAESRLHRLGQTRNVTYYDLIAKGTVDELVLEMVLSKKSLSETLFGVKVEAADEIAAEFGGGIEVLTDLGVEKVKAAIEKQVAKAHGK